MKLAVVRLLSLLAPLALSAAIITEDNTYTATPPSYAAFPNGIRSCWIPWGTYTDGVGSTEYTRVTSNLVGVVASALGGFYERDESGGTFYKALLSPLEKPADYWSDTGEYLSTVTNQSMRLADQLNVGPLHYYVDSGKYYYNTADHSLERLLVRDETSETYEFDSDGNATAEFVYRGNFSGTTWRYGGRVLEEIVGVQNIPISTEWSSAIPYNIADSNTWSLVAPVYSATQIDGTFWSVHGGGTTTYWWETIPVLDGYDRAGLLDFLTSWVNGIFGDDVYNAGMALRGAVLRTPLPCTLQDVLGHDTGWSTNVYSHWTNGTTRLDWKRLGIVCQLERQMEITYETGPTPDLPFFEMTGNHTKVWEGYVNITPPAPSYIGETCEMAMGSPSWTLVTNNMVTNLTQLGWLYPTVRAPAPNASGHIGASDVDGPSGAFTATTNVLDALASECLTPLGTFGGTYTFKAKANIGTRNQPPAISLKLTDAALYSGDEMAVHVGDSSTAYVSADMPTNATVRAYRNLYKSGTVRYTRTRTEDRSAIIANFSDSRGESWSNGVIKAEWRPTLDAMIAVYGDDAESLASETHTWGDPMDWDDIHETYATARFFRLNPFTGSAASLSASNNLRFQQISSLSAATKAKCVDLGGVDANYAWHAALLTDAEEQEMCDNLADGKLTATFGVAAEDFGDNVIASAEVSCVDGDYRFGSWTFAGDITRQEVDGGIVLGSGKWTFDGVGTSTTNHYTSVRVDALSLPLVKTLWKFKNLRDPNL